MTPLKSGPIESLTWDERGGKLRLSGTTSDISIYEVQKPSLPKDLKKGDNVTVETVQRGHFEILLSLQRQEVTIPQQTAEEIAQIIANAPAQPIPPDVVALIREADSKPQVESPPTSITVSEPQLPDSIPELQRFILVTHEALKAYRVRLDAVDKLGLAQSIRNQTLEDGQKIGTALLWAEAKLGELLKTMTEGKGYDELPSKGGRKPTLPEGISHKQSHYAQQLAEHKDLIEEVIREAKESEDIPTRTQVLQKVKEKQLSEHKRIPESIEVSGSADRESLSAELVLNSVWPLAHNRPKGYGSELFRGNTPPEVLAQCLAHYTAPNDLVLDPMAGSGTAIDVCTAMSRRVIASDIKAWRDDVPPADAETLAIKEPVDFAFMHIPYLDMYEYTDQPADLSKMQPSEFEEKLDKIVAHIAESLKPSKFLAILVGDVRKSGLIDLAASVSLIGQRHLKLWDKAIIETTNIGAHGSAAHGNIGLLMNRAKRLNFLIPIHDTLLIFRRDEK